MKIAFDAKRAFHNSTGLGNFSRDLLCSLSQADNDLDLILLDPKPDRGMRHWIPNNGRVVAPSGIWRKLHPLWRSLRAGRMAQNAGAQIYHGLSNELPRDLSKTSLRSVVTIHDLIFETHPHLFPGPDVRIYKQKFRHASESADVVVCVSEYTRNILCNLYGISKEKTRLIYQSCHADFFSSKNYGLRPIEKPYFIMVGRIEERKNHLLAIRALHLLNNHDVQLVIIGSETHFTSVVKKEIEKLDLSKRVHFKQNIDLPTLISYYHHSQALLYPSIVEGFGIPILEAFLCETMVITNQKGVFSEAGGEQALYIDVENPGEMAGAMTTVLDKTFDRQEKIRRARERIVQTFSPENQARQYIELYRQMIS